MKPSRRPAHLNRPARDLRRCGASGRQYEYDLTTYRERLALVEIAAGNGRPSDAAKVAELKAIIADIELA